MIKAQLTKDVQRFALHIVLWWGFLGVTTLSLFVLASLSSGADAVMLNGFLLFRSYLLAVLTALIILEDPVADDRAFWLSRPIGRFDLLLAKVCLLFFALALPVAMSELIVLAWWDLEPGLLPVLGIEILLGQGTVIAGTAALAIVTPNIRTFLVVGVAAVVGLWFVDPLSSPILGSLDLPLKVPMITLRTLTWLLLVILLGSATVIHQCSTRKTSRSIALLAMSWACVFLIFGRDWMDRTPRRVMTSELTLASVIERPFPGDVTELVSPDRMGRAALYGILELEGRDEVAHGYTLGVTQGDFKLDEGLLIRGEQLARSYGHRRVMHGAGFRRWLADQGMEIMDTRHRASGRLTKLAEVTNLDYSRWAEAPGSYRGTIEVTAYRYELLGELPRGQGGRLRKGFNEILITKIDRKASELSLELRCRTLDSLLQLPMKNLVLVLRRGKETLPLGKLLRLNSQLPYGAKFAIQDVSELWSWSEDDFDPGWLREATTLMVFQAREVGTFTRELVIDDFRMRDYTAAAWQARLKAEINERRGMSDASR